jgi:hypothetical protein
MAGRFLGYDPKLGEKFFKESKGSVIGRARSSPSNSEEDDPLAKYQDPQEAHDEAMQSRTPPSSDPQAETEGDEKRAWALRLARMKNQNEQFAKRAKKGR